MGESQVAYFVIMLRKSIDGLLAGIVPDDDVRVFSSLTRCKHISIVGYSETGDCIIMSCQEVLIVGVLNVAHDDATADDQDVLARTWMQTDTVDD